MELAPFLEQIELLTGSPIKTNERDDHAQLTSAIQSDHLEIGASQFNELLLMVNKDRVSESFFNRFFCECVTDEERKTCTIGDIPAGITRFQKAAMLQYGNFVFAYRKLSRASTAAVLSSLLSPLDAGPTGELTNKLRRRHPQLVEIQKIDRDETFLIGYISPREIIADNARAEALTKAFNNPAKLKAYRENARDKDPVLRGLAESLLRLHERITKGLKRKDARARIARDRATIKMAHDRLFAVRQKGIANTDTYLSWDYMDVYFATSMRQKWEYEDLFDFVGGLVKRRELKGLKLRYFDPTQSFEENRIDKGLVEALMLKRAACTVYSVQDTDTLGKDSELAATLAQGKPVIAYAPNIDVAKRSRYLQKEHPSVMRARANFVEAADDVARAKFAADPLRSVIDALNVFEEQRIWASLVDSQAVAAFRKKGHDVQGLCKTIAQAEQAIYDRRASTLQEHHPLAIQVNLDTGVANGVLVARDIPTCARLIRRIVTNSMRFNVKKDAATKSWHLVEEETQSIFRVVTRNPKLTNAFWNFYRNETDKGARNARA
jgi:hypothetical protein